MGEEVVAATGTDAGSGATEEAVELLGELIRLDTSNPPGNEQPAQELLAERLSAAGFDCELLAAEPGRPNLVARLRGEGRDGAGADGLEEAVERLRAVAPELVAYVIDPILRVTLVPTRASASEKANVIPSRAEVLVDCRAPPGIGEAEVRERAIGVLGRPGEASEGGGYELEFVEHVVGNRSPTRSPLADEISAWLAAADPDARLVPIAMAGFSDSHWFRKAFDSAVVYGFCPQREMSLLEATPLVHGADERAAVADVELATRFYRDISQAMLG